MEWIKKPIVMLESTKQARDTCAAHVCWKNEGGGACAFRWCVTRICVIDL